MRQTLPTYDEEFKLFLREGDCPLIEEGLSP
jgi:hypothetical protein